MTAAVAEPKCADCGHGTLAHNAIGAACTVCECGHFIRARGEAGETRTDYACGCTHFFAGTLGSLTRSVTCNEHDNTRPRPVPASPAQRGMPDWEKTLLGLA